MRLSDDSHHRKFLFKAIRRKHHNALVSALIYTVTIVLILALAVLILGTLIDQLANSDWFNLGLGLVLIFFALSLLGMYEIELPNGLRDLLPLMKAKAVILVSFSWR